MFRNNSNNNKGKETITFLFIQNDGSHSKRILDSPVSFWFRDQSICYRKIIGKNIEVKTNVPLTSPKNIVKKKNL